jgi:hypothetical protein
MSGKKIYPDLAELLRNELTLYKKKHPKLTQNTIAANWEISQSDFSEVVSGSKHPSPAFIKRFVNGRYPDIAANKNARDKLTSAIIEEAKKGQPSLDTLRKKLKAGEDLRVTTINYPPFAGSPRCFFESVFSRFLDLAGIRYDTPTCRVGNRLQDYKNSDFSLGMFDSADRMLTLDRKFWRVPVRMGLGAICLRQHKEHEQAIANLLSNHDAIEDLHIVPIVVTNDVGWRHCINRLKFLERHIKIKELDSIDISQLAGQLTALGKHETQIPVICTDEYTCLHILSELKNVGYSIFPMNSRRTGQDEKESTRRELPQFYCSVGVDGNDREFHEFMQDALEQFVSTEIETTAHSWAELAGELVKKVSVISREQMPAHPRSTQLNTKISHDPSLREVLNIANAWEWVFYTLSLDLKSIESYPNFNNLPWRPILLRARTLVQIHIADQKACWKIL